MGKIVHLSVKSRYRFILLTTTTLILVWTFSFSTQLSLLKWPELALTTTLWPQNHPQESIQQEQQQIPIPDLQAEFFTWSEPDDPLPPKPRYKPLRQPAPPIPDPFPLLSSNPPPKKSLLKAPEQNRPPKKNYKEKTPLFIGFTRNWPQLLQCVVSYIAAGWPPEDIFVVENTGVMFSNRDGKLTLQNPFYLNHTQLSMLGVVNVVITPTLLTFAQLQNFFLHFSLTNNLPYFFWTHQDLLVFTDESSDPPYTLYDRAVSVLQSHLLPSSPKWAHHFFSYDHLTLVNRDVVLSVGGWDTHIPFYATDCDLYVRLMWEGYWQDETDIGYILDVSSVLDDLGVLLRIPGTKISYQGLEQTGELTWETLVLLGQKMEREKYSDGYTWRNTWQVKQQGGQGEPFYRDWEGFEIGTKKMIDMGREVFAEKWGHGGCDIARIEGLRGGDAWRLERDWEEEEEEEDGEQEEGD
ncbi:hypothetical protein QBC38DRAFT_518093 [Podospora fimiseda]|uniref:Uncharacterized protein n=1 Tax=Podospora fimiseda TaxID=252190 RepID=A0AAN6YQ61_9PEZI|nr:hypothetical protein QBC38DRAFT_518093 [Podospora fimiseda]